MILRYRAIRAGYRTLGLLHKYVICVWYLATTAWFRVNRTNVHYPQLAVLTRYYASNERSKVEETLRMLKEDLQRQQEEDAKQKKVVSARTRAVLFRIC